MTIMINRNLKGALRSIRSLASFYKSNPPDDWEDLMGEAAVMVRETNEAAYLATV
jgi:hypothetical protein